MDGKIGFIGAAAIASLAGWNWSGFNTTYGTIEVVRSMQSEIRTCASGPRRVSADVLNVRLDPFGGDVIDQLRRGARVTVTDCHANWSQIGLGRWVHTDYLSPLVSLLPPSRTSDRPASTPAATTPAVPVTCTPGPHYVTADALRVRTRPVDGEILGPVTRGEYVPVSRCDGVWAEIAPGRWVHAGYLTATPSSQTLARN